MTVRSKAPTRVERLKLAYRPVDRGNGVRQFDGSSRTILDYTCHMAMLQNSRTLTISLPENIADRLEAMAAEEGCDPSDLLVEGFKRVIMNRVNTSLETARAEARARGGDQYTEDDVERLVDEVRAEMAAEREAQSKLTA